MKTFKYTTMAVVLLGAAAMNSCSSDFMDTTPTDKIPDALIKETVDNLYTALNGTHRAMYIQYNSQDQGGEASMNIDRDMLGEDLVNASTGNGWFIATSRWISHRNPNASLVSYPFEFYYKLILNANFFLETIDNADGEDKNLRTGIKAEALCFRAWSHFQLVQLYGKRYEAGKTNDQLGIPYKKQSEMANAARNTVEEVYQYINEDLDAAIELMKEYTPEDINHFSLEVAYGLKARVALTQQNWADAAKFAGLAIETATANGRRLMSGDELKNGFAEASKNSEWMWASLVQSDQTIYFYSFMAFMSWNYNSTNIRQNPKCILDRLYSQISETDVRRQWWDPTGEAEMPASSFTPAPYQNRKFAAKSMDTPVSDVVYMRLAEMYLIKAEAEARSGKEGDAKNTLLSFVQTRDPEYKLSANTGTALVDEILTQRRIELWGEGFRFTDLKRLNQELNRADSNHDESVSQTMTVPAGDKRWEFVIPQDELDANPEMVQNEL